MAHSEAEKREAIEMLISWHDYGGDAPEMLSDALVEIRKAFGYPEKEIVQ